MQLSELLADLPDVAAQTLPTIEVHGVQEDSRRVSTGDLFIARSPHAGGGFDGKRFVADAQRAGAVAVLADGPIDRSPLPTIVVNDAGRLASILANRLARDPSRHMQVLGVTGTNGKTTTAFLLRHLAAFAQQRCGLIGTCVIDDGIRRRVADMTTPGPVQLAEMLATMRDKGCKAVAMEVSSHALDQGRSSGVTFAGAGFTNLTGDHLDYHGTMEAYAAAKAKLFDDLPVGTPAVVNRRDPWSDAIIKNTNGRVVGFGVGGEANGLDYHAGDLAVTAESTTFRLATPRGEADVTMKLVGRHNVENALCAAALIGEVYELDAAALSAALADAPAAPGRLERVDHDAGDFAVFVDYAHTDDALDNVLRALRPVTRGRLRVVFGCGGDRDKSKRPRMAAVAERLADDVIVTSDNPRTEAPTAIIDDVLAGFADASAVTAEPDRRAAIVRALADARDGDIVLIAGKGHEDYQIVGTERLSFDDAVECRRALKMTSVGA